MNCLIASLVLTSYFLTFQRNFSFSYANDNHDLNNRESKKSNVDSGSRRQLDRTSIINDCFLISRTGALK